MRISLAAAMLAAVSAAAATPAFAQDTDSGGAFRIEARAGLDRPVFKLDYKDATRDFEASEGKSGVAYGGEVGYDLHSSSLLYGVYAGVDLADTRYCGGLAAADFACAKTGRNITAGVRAGYRIGAGSALYAKAGYSNARLKLSNAGFVGPGANVRDASNLDGFHLGAGAEVGLGGPLYVKAEYLYTNYGGYRYTQGASALKLGMDRHQLLAGVGARF